MSSRIRSAATKASSLVTSRHPMEPDRHAYPAAGGWPGCSVSPTGLSGWRRRRRAPGPRPTRVGGLRHDPTGVAPGRHLGDASLIGPGDPARGIDVPFLLRDVFRAAGGSHEDRDEYDRAMRDDPASGRLRPPRPRARHRMTWPSRRHSGGTEAVPPSTSSRFPHDVADGIAHRADSGVEPRRTGSGSLRVGASCRTTSGGRRASSSAGPSRTCCPSSRRCVDPKVCRAAIRSRSG